MIIKMIVDGGMWWGYLGNPWHVRMMELGWRQRSRIKTLRLWERTGVYHHTDGVLWFGSLAARLFRLPDTLGSFLSSLW
jgi:hypothetical protein